ncbi:hypothetical protein TNCT_251241 [Trichonephila clavata]|uniref:Uncharacterized protein n=1 Tax=Trichonephila clavata TaxID=2740835 RepID=A0A8X6IU89_TRICU|nr:hypothetical protein TNCT_251241 [Trichonephila clavata]
MSVIWTRCPLQVIKPVLMLYDMRCKMTFLGKIPHLSYFQTQNRDLSENNTSTTRCPNCNHLAVNQECSPLMKCLKELQQLTVVSAIVPHSTR